MRPVQFVRSSSPRRAVTPSPSRPTSARRDSFVRAALSIVERSPLLAELIESVTDDEILFANGTAVSAFPCTSRGARGWPISTLLDDGAHFVSHTEGSQVAERGTSSRAARRSRS